MYNTPAFIEIFIALKFLFKYSPVDDEVVLKSSELSEK